MNTRILGLLLFLLVVLPLIQSEESAYSGVEIISAVNLTEMPQGHQKLLIFFAEQSCLNCLECSEIYAITNKQHPEAAKYTKIYLSNQTRPIFQQYNVTDFPRILAFINGKLSPYQYQCLGSKNNINLEMFKWIERLDNSLKEWGEEKDHQHQLIVHCDSEDLKKMWKRIERTQLWLDLYCGNAQLLGNKLALVSQFGHTIEAWHFQSENQEQFEKKMLRLIKSYQYKYVLNWNTAVAQQIFLNNQSAFIMLVNNQSYSMQIYSAFQDIKQNWYENTDRYLPVIFAVSDLARNTYETIRLKHFLTGITTATNRDYPYPILAFVKSGFRPIKYLLKSSSMTKEAIELWIQSIHEHIILNHPYEQGQEVIHEYLNQYKADNKKGKEKQSSQSLDEEIALDDEVKQLKNQEEWQRILNKSFTSPCFVYITWRNNLQLQIKQSEVISFWQKREPKQRSPMEKIPLFVHQLHRIDLPKQLSVKVEYVPSILYIGPDKKVQLRQGVTDLNKIKDFYQQKLKMKQSNNMPLHR